MALYLDVGPDDLLKLGTELKVTVVRKSGSRVRLKIEGAAPVELIKKGRDLPPEKGDGRDE
jgi:hypothetical protein